MADSSAPTSDDGESRRRLSSTKSFLSHLHEKQGAKRVGGRGHQPAIIDADGSDVGFTAGNHPLVSSFKGSAAGSWPRSLVSFGDVQVQSDDDAIARRLGRQATGGDDKISLSTCAASNDAVAHLSQRRDIPPRSLTSLTPPDKAVPDGEYTFRCSSTMPHSPNSRSSVPGIDLVGTIICAQNESPVSSISSHRFSGKSTSADDGDVLNTWLRETYKLRTSAVLAKGGKEGSPIVPKSFIELAKIRREREATEDSDSDSMSSMSTSDNDSNDDNGGAERANKGLRRLLLTSQSRPALPVTPRVSVKSAPAAREALFGRGPLTPAKSREAPEELDSGLTSTYRKSDSKNDSHGGRSKATKVFARAPMISPSRPALEVNPRVSFKTTTVMPKSPRRDGGRKRPQARVVRDEYEGQTANKKFGAASAHHFNDDSSPASARGIPKSFPAAVEPRAVASAGTTAKTVERSNPASGETSSDTNWGSPVLPTRPNAVLEGAAATVSTTATNSDTVAFVGRTAECDLTGAARLASAGGEKTEDDHAGSSPNRDSAAKSSTLASHGSSAAIETSNKVHPKGRNISSTAVEDVAEMNEATIPLPPGELAVPKPSREEASSAGFHLEAARFPDSKADLHDMSSPGEGSGDQDAIDSQPKLTGSKAGSVGSMTGGAPSTTIQRRKAIVNVSASVVGQLMLFDALLQQSGGGRAASTPSESTLEGHDSDADSSGTENEINIERKPEAVLGRSDGPLRPDEEEAHQSGMRERQHPRQQGIAMDAESAEKKGGDEEAQGDRQAYGVPPPPSEDGSVREKRAAGDGDDHHAEREEPNAGPNAAESATAAGLVESSSQAGPPAHPVADSRGTSSVTTTCQDSAQPTTEVAAKAVSVGNPDLRLDSSPYTAVLLTPPLSAADAGSSKGSGRNKRAASKMTRQETRPRVSSRKDVRRRGSGKSQRESLPPTTTRAASSADPWRARILAEVTTTLANRGDTSRPVAFSPAEMVRGTDSVSDCGDDNRKRGKRDSALLNCGPAAPMENPGSSATRDSSIVSFLTEAVASIPNGRSMESLAAFGPPEQSRMDGRPEACDISGTNRDALAREVAAKANVVGGVASVSLAKRSLMVANASSAEKLAAVSDAEDTGSARRERTWDDGRWRKGRAERAASASHPALSRRESSVLPDRWSIRILAEAAATLARCGVAGRSVAVSLARISSTGPSFQGSGRRRHTSTSAEKTPSAGGTGGRCSASRCPRQRPSRTMAQRRSKVGVAASSNVVHRWTVCGSGPTSELPMIVDFGSSLVGVSTSAGSRERKDTASCVSTGSLYRRQRGEEPTRPRGNCESRASLSLRESFQHRSLGGGADESEGGGCVSRGRRRRSTLPTPQKSKCLIPTAFQGWECPKIVDFGSVHA